MSFLRQFDQTYHKHWFLKCQLKKESHESLRNIPRLFNAASVERVSRYLPSLVCWPAGADRDYPTVISLFTGGGASDLSPADLREGWENSQYQG